jgi:hypothetical protein
MELIERCTGEECATTLHLQIEGREVFVRLAGTVVPPREGVSALPVSEGMQPTWRQDVPRPTAVNIQLSFKPPLELTWEEFTDLANCCKQLAEEGEHGLNAARVGCAYVEIKKLVRSGS